MNIFKGNNRATTVIDGNQHYILHSTSIVIQSKNGIILSSGGWMPATTKRAMNEVGSFLGFTVYQKNGKWFVIYNNKTFEYFDGILLK
jgi:hypothetical protein